MYPISVSTVSRFLTPLWIPSSLDILYLVRCNFSPVPVLLIALTFSDGYTIAVRYTLVFDQLLTLSSASSAHLVVAKSAAAVAAPGAKCTHRQKWLFGAQIW